MEKQLAALGYWLGLVCFVLAVIIRLLNALGLILPRMVAQNSTPISQTTFVHGAALFFLLAIASWCRTAKP